MQVDPGQRNDEFWGSVAAGTRQAASTCPFVVISEEGDDSDDDAPRERDHRKERSRVANPSSSDRDADSDDGRRAGSSGLRSLRASLNTRESDGEKGTSLWTPGNAGHVPDAPDAFTVGLTHAIRGGNVQMVIDLLQKGADANTIGDAGQSPLVEALATGDINVTAALLLHGADPTQLAPSGVDPSTFATQPALKTLLEFFSGAEIREDSKRLVLAALEKIVRWRLAKRLGEMQQEQDKMRLLEKKKSKLAQMDQLSVSTPTPANRGTAKTVVPPRARMPTTTTSTLAPQAKLAAPRASRLVEHPPSSAVQTCGGCGRTADATEGRVGEDDGKWYCGSCWAEFEQTQSFRCLRTRNMNKEVFQPEPRTLQDFKGMQVEQSDRIPKKHEPSRESFFGNSSDGQLASRGHANVPAETPLALATRSGNLQEVLRLLVDGCDPNIADFTGETPLFDCIAGGNVDIAAAMLLFAADPNRRSSAGSVPSNFASHASARSLLQVFASHDGAACENREEALGALPAFMRWALQLHLDGRGFAAVRYLGDCLQNGDAMSASPQSFTSVAARGDEHDGLLEDEGLLPLTSAVRRKHYQQLRDLLRARADPNAADELGETPLFEAAALDDADAAALLLLARADPSRQSLAGTRPPDLARRADCPVAILMLLGSHSCDTCENEEATEAIAAIMDPEAQDAFSRKWQFLRDQSKLLGQICGRH